MSYLLRSLTDNWKLKLLAFGLAILLWVIVSAEEVTSNWIPLPLEVQVADPEFRLIEGSVPPEVEVRFVGPGRELWDLVVRRPPVVLRVGEVTDAEESFRLDPDMAQLPNRLSVNPLDIRPSEVRLQFVPLDSRTVPIRIRVTRELGAGWTLTDSLSVQPRRVRVSGPRTQVDAIDAVPTVGINLSATDSVFSRIVALDTTGLGGVRLSATRVRITGQIDRMAEVNFLQVPISVGSGVFVMPATANVQIYGGRSAVQSVGPESLRIVLSLDSIPDRIPPEGIAVPLRVEGLPPGVQSAMSPRVVRILPAPGAGTAGDTVIGREAGGGA